MIAHPRREDLAGLSPEDLATRAFGLMALRIERARADVNDFIELIGEVPGGRMIQDPAHRRWQSFWDEHQKSVLLAPIGVGKAVPVETEISTPHGWRQIGDLEVGDVVHGGDGLPTAVTYVSPVWTDHEVWAVGFDDGTTIRSDADHQWLAWSPHDAAKGKAPRVTSTATIVARMRRGGKGWQIPLCGAVAYPSRALAEDPEEYGRRLRGTHEPLDGAYLLGSIEQREALVRGLAGRGARYESTSVEQARGVAEVVRSLGFKVRQRERVVEWYRDAATKTIVSCRRVATVPVRCIAVEAAHHTYIATRDYIVTHNTSNLRHRLLWMVGRNPNLQIAYISATERHPKRVLRAWKAEVERNERVKWVFPRLQRGKVWTTTDVEVKRSTIDPNPTFQIYPAFSQSVLGSRADVVVFDDLCNYGNTLTEYAREKMAEWLGEVLSRLRADARVMAIGHIWHDQDQLQRLSKIEGWGYQRDEAYSIEKATGERIPLAPRAMSLKAIDDKARDLGPVQAEMMLFNRMPSRSLGRFKQAMFDRCLALGRGLRFADDWRGSPTYTGVDLGFTKEVGSDLTVMFTVAVIPGGKRQVIDVRSGKWSGTEIITQLKDVQRCYGSILAVETNGGVNLLMDVASDIECLAISRHNTNASNKHNIAHGVETLALELDQGRWLLPCDDKGVPPEKMAKAIYDCMSYSPKRHTGDYLMAWWICREAIRQSPAVAPGMELPSFHDLLHR